MSNNITITYFSPRLSILALLIILFVSRSAAAAPSSWPADDNSLLDDDRLSISDEPSTFSDALITCPFTGAPITHCPTTIPSMTQAKYLSIAARCELDASYTRNDHCSACICGHFTSEFAMRFNKRWLAETAFSENALLKEKTLRADTLVNWVVTKRMDIKTPGMTVADPSLQRVSDSSTSEGHLYSSFSAKERASIPHTRERKSISDREVGFESIIFTSLSLVVAAVYWIVFRTSEGAKPAITETYNLRSGSKVKSGVVRGGRGRGTGRARASARATTRGLSRGRQRL